MFPRRAPPTVAGIGDPGSEAKQFLETGVGDPGYSIGLASVVTDDDLCSGSAPLSLSADFFDLCLLFFQAFVYSLQCRFQLLHFGMLLEKLIEQHGIDHLVAHGFRLAFGTAPKVPARELFRSLLANFFGAARKPPCNTSGCSRGRRPRLQSVSCDLCFLGARLQL